MEDNTNSTETEARNDNPAIMKTPKDDNTQLLFQKKGRLHQVKITSITQY